MLDKTKSYLLIDTETSGLLGPKGEPPENLWLTCTEDLWTGEKRDFKLEENQNLLPDYIQQYDYVVGHNIIGFDAWILKYLAGIALKLDKMIDTRVLSKLNNPDRSKNGQDPLYKGSRPHSIEAFGERFRFPKGEFPPELFPVFMDHYEEGLKYCRRDVDILRKTLFYLIREKEQLSISDTAFLAEQKVQFYITQQETNGFAVDHAKIDALMDEVSSRALQYQKEITKNFSPLPAKDRVFTPRYTKSGEIASNSLTWLGEDKKYAGIPEEFRGEELDGSLTRVNWVPFSLDSPKQIVQRLNRLGWSPVEKTKAHIQAQKDFKAGRIPPERLAYFQEWGWKVSETNLETLSDDAPEDARHIRSYIMCESRRRLIDKQWYPNIVEGRIHGRCDPLGTGTHRMSHSDPNLANNPSIVKTADGTPLKGFEGRYGYEVRECFTVGNTDTHVLLGADASGLELRILCHFMNDPEYTNTVVNGDIHSMNQKAAGLATRDMAKTFIYALLYGAGAEKIGSIVNGGYRSGLQLKERFLSAIPALAYLMKKVKKAAKSKGGVPGLDGRFIHVRSEYSALNTLLQGNGAIVCKWWLIYIMNSVRKRRVDARLVASVHDEYQFEVAKKDVESMTEIVHTAIKKGEETFKMKCPLDCTVSTGLNWAETH